MVLGTCRCYICFRLISVRRKIYWPNQHCYQNIITETLNLKKKTQYWLTYKIHILFIKVTFSHVINQTLSCIHSNVVYNVKTLNPNPVELESSAKSGFVWQKIQAPLTWLICAQRKFSDRSLLNGSNWNDEFKCYVVYIKFSFVKFYDFLPLSEIWPKCMYVLYILQFSMPSIPKIHSSCVASSSNLHSHKLQLLPPTRGDKSHVVSPLRCLTPRWIQPIPAFQRIINNQITQ